MIHFSTIFVHYGLLAMYLNRLFSSFTRVHLQAIAALLLVTIGCQSPRTTLKAIQDQKWEKADVALNKKLTSPKDSLHADTYYLYSLLYSDSAYVHYKVDTAYHFILSATQDFNKISEKEKLKLAKTVPLDSTILLSQKRRLDSLAFGEAQADSTVRAYQTFLDRHSDAPHREEAVRLRNQLAFGAARQMDTYQAYREFMDTYPEAKQFSQAEERFNTLVFQAQTKTGNLTSYYQFLDAFPQSPYRFQAEQAIFSITTASNHLASYAAFARDFPNSPLIHKAVNWLYHLYQASHPADSFFITFSDLPLLDSLKEAQSVASEFLLPYWDKEFGFINTSGATAITPRFTSILPEYLCHGVPSAQLFGVTEKIVYMLNKNGDTIHSFEIENAKLEEVRELGGGLIWISLGNSGTLLHISGQAVISPQENVTNVELLPSTNLPYQFIKYQVAGQWGLKSFTGTTLLPPNYDDISEYNQFIVLEGDGKLAVTNRDILTGQVANPNFQAEFLYEDVTLLDEDFLLAYTEEYETVLDTTLTQVVPLKKHTILHRILLTDEDVFLLRTNEEKQRVQNDSLITEQVFHYSLAPRTISTLPSSFSQAYYNDQWLTLKQEQKYYLYDKDSLSFSSKTYDSVKIVSEHFALTFSKGSNSTDSVRLLIAGQSPMFLPTSSTTDEEVTFRLHAANTSILSSVEESILIDQPGQPDLLLTQTGDTVLFADVDRVSAYPEGLYALEKKNKQGIIDQYGNEIVPVRYERIGSYQSDGLISIFDRKKFGTYHPQTGTIIEPAYEGLLRYYSVVLQDSVPVPTYIAKKNGKFGIIDAKEQLLLPFEFQAVRYWNAQAALVKYNNLWHIYALEKASKRRLPFDEEAIQYADIIEFSELPTTNAEKLLKIYKNSDYGILSNQRGEVLKPTFDDIRLIAHPQTQESLYLTEKYVSEAKLHILIYLDTQGEIIFRQAYDPDAYDQLYCDE